MAGAKTASAFLGWHGLDGDRRFGLRRLKDKSAFPWLNASRFPQLLLYHPFGLDESTGEPLPTHVRTPAGAEVGLHSKELQSEIGDRWGADVEMMHLQHGIFDDAAISVINEATIAGIGREASLALDRRRFRANILLETQDAEPFLEDGWIGGTLVFGDRDNGPAVTVTARDVRCMMINLDPETAVQNAEVLRTVVRINSNHAGVYATVVRTGMLQVGDAVRLM